MVAHQRAGVSEKVEDHAGGLPGGPLAVAHPHDLDLAGRDELVVDAGAREHLAGIHGPGDSGVAAGGLSSRTTFPLSALRPDVSGCRLGDW